MNEIAQAKAKVRLRNWWIMYQSKAESGQKVSQWCAENSVNPRHSITGCKSSERNPCDRKSTK